MGASRTYVAVDLGAESGRVMRGELTAERELRLTEMHRFPNGPRTVGEALRWDFDGITREIRSGLARTGRPDGIGVNSWGVDYGLLDDAGALIEAPYHYRDRRTDGMLDAAFSRMPRREIYEHTGIQFMQLNTLFQLLSMRLANDPALARAKRMVFFANLVAHHLGAPAVAEYTLASTSQMLNMRSGKWSQAVLDRLGLPRSILPEVVQPGTVTGALCAEVARETGCGAAPIIAIGSHDTASAVAAVPAEGEDWAYISSGTWSLMGLELPAPVINETSYECGLTNEGGVEGTIRLLRNIMGLWLVQECKRQWARDGEDLSYAELTEMARAAKPFAARIQPDQPPFFAPGDMPARINAWLGETGQKPLADKGQMVRAILEGLAFTYRDTLQMLERASGRAIRAIHIVGGGSQNELLSQFAANATGLPVITGPVEATSAGNVLMQARALGDIRSLAELRDIVRRSFPTKRFDPQDAASWEKEASRREGR